MLPAGLHLAVRLLFDDQVDVGMASAPDVSAV
jgi:hypothetical protein